MFVTIGVYRIYVSHAWDADPALARVIAALDAYPAFLYRIDRITPEDLAVACEGGERSAVRVAMTQTHVMLAPVGRPSDAHPHPALPQPSDAHPHPAGAHIGKIELELARTGFRRRIPVLGIASPDMDPAAVRPLGFDRVVTINPSALTCAIQELAEEAAAERRAAYAMTLRQPPVELAQHRTTPAVAVRQLLATTAPATNPLATFAPATAGPRALPINDIVEAYRNLVASRPSTKPVS